MDYGVGYVRAPFTHAGMMGISGVLLLYTAMIVPVQVYLSAPIVSEVLYVTVMSTSYAASRFSLTG
jgi:hypothetical protein